MIYPWTEKDIAKLESLIKENHTKTEIADVLGRTVASVQIKANRMGLQIFNTSDNTGNRGRTWTQKDVRLLKELWSDGAISKSKMETQLHRSWYSIRKKALQLELGPREYNTEYLSISTICKEMCVSHDRVSNWLKLGLKKRKNHSGKVKYLIDPDDLLVFLKNHQNIFNASLVSEYLFFDEPEWFIEKRKKDAKEYANSNRLEYTNDEDKRIVNMFMRGKSDAEIAKELNRTETGIKYHRMTLGLLRNRYSPEEIEILQKYSDSKTLAELAKMLPLRSQKGIAYKCESLGIPYHISKDCCKNSNRKD